MFLNYHILKVISMTTYLLVLSSAKISKFPKRTTPQQQEQLLLPPPPSSLPQQLQQQLSDQELLLLPNFKDIFRESFKQLQQPPFTQPSNIFNENVCYACKVSLQHINNNTSNNTTTHTSNHTYNNTTTHTSNHTYNNTTTHTNNNLTPTPNNNNAGIITKDTEYEKLLGNDFLNYVTIPHESILGIIGGILCTENTNDGGDDDGVGGDDNDVIAGVASDEEGNGGMGLKDILLASILGTLLCGIIIITILVAFIQMKALKERRSKKDENSEVAPTEFKATSRKYSVLSHQHSSFSLVTQMSVCPASPADVSVVEGMVEGVEADQRKVETTESVESFGYEAVLVEVFEPSQEHQKPTSQPDLLASQPDPLASQSDLLTSTSQQEEGLEVVRGQPQPQASPHREVPAHYVATTTKQPPPPPKSKPKVTPQQPHSPIKQPRQPETLPKTQQKHHLQPQKQFEHQPQPPHLPHRPQPQQPAHLNFTPPHTQAHSRLLTLKLSEIGDSVVN